MGRSTVRNYNYIGSTGYEILHCVDDEGWEILCELDGTSVASTWKPLRVRWVRGSRREGFRASVIRSPWAKKCASRERLRYPRDRAPHMEKRWRGLRRKMRKGTRARVDVEGGYA